MNRIQQYKQALFSVGNDIKEICAALYQQTPIDYFCYMRSYFDGRFLHLTDHTAWLDYFVDNRYDKVSRFRDPLKTTQEKIILCSPHIQGPAKKIAQNAAQHFNIKNVVALIDERTTGRDVFQFGSQNENIYEFYFNNIQMLRQFTYYFKDKARSVIESFEKRKILLPPRVQEQHDSLSAQYKILERTFFNETHRFYIDDNLFVTKREIEIMKWCAYGKTSHEISILLNLSKRTVDKHLENIKQKFSCSKQAYAIALLAKKGLILNED